MSCRRRRNRGSILDIPVLVFLFLGVVMTVIFGYVLVRSFSDNVQGNPAVPAEAQAVAVTSADNFLYGWDRGLSGYIVLMGLALVVSSFMLNSNPLFFVFSVIMLAFGILVSAVVVNVYETMVGTGVLIQYTDDFLMLPLIMSHLVQITVGLGLMMLVGLYARRRQDVGYG